MELRTDICIENRDNVVEYPNGKYCYNPSVCYPEYPFDNEIAPEKNEVYDMVRECIKRYGLDRNHYGTKDWNPLGDIIDDNNNVLIKPNWVMDFNKALKDKNDLDCLVTHPSVVRVVVDYVYIALRGKGKIIVADAPMQDCDLENMFRNAGYKSLFEFWQKYIPGVEIYDLRKYSSTFKNGIITERKSNGSQNKGIIVDLKEKSMHYLENESGNVIYKVSDYSCEKTNDYHHVNKHQYELNELALQADVIINIPKPKCHRLAGMTAGMKNLVGVVYEKSSLPHRKLGDFRHNGDSYKNSSFFKNIMQICDEQKTKYSENGYGNIASMWSFGEKVTYVLGSILSGDKIRIGGWYGNDTIWRTVVDLNYIMLYAGKNGLLEEKKQRKILTIGDMIICGQKNGPISPQEKKLGMIMIGENNVVFDEVMSSIMGFERNKIRSLSDPKALSMFGYDKEKLDEIKIDINNSVVMLKNFVAKEQWEFESHDMWKGHIEKGK